MANNIKYGIGIKSVSELTTEDSRAIRKLYEDLTKQIQKEVERLSNKNDPTATDSLKKLQLKDLQKSLNNNLKEINRKTQNIIKNGMTNAAQNVVNQGNSWLNSIGINIKTSYANVPQDVVANIISGRLYGNDWEFSKRIWGDYNKSKGDISYIVAKGIAENKSTYEIAKDLEKYVNPNARKPWDWGKVYPGTKKVIDYNAQRMARTMINHAYQQSVIEISKDNPFVSGIQWKAAFAKTTCEICESRNNVIYPVNSVPLDHPNGKCTFIAVINKSYKEIADDLANWVNGEENEGIDKFAKSAGFDKKDFDINKFAAKDSKSKIKSVNDIQTKEDAIQFLQDSNYFHVQYSKDGKIFRDWNIFNVENFEGIDINVLKSVINSYDRLFSKYPFLKGRIKGFEFGDAKEAGVYGAYGWTMGFSLYNSRIYLDKTISNNFNDFLGSLRKDINDGWHPKIDNNMLIESVVTHEYGHVMEGLYRIIKGIEGEPSKNIRKNIMSEFGGLDSKIITKELSKYATTNSKEWFAEAFCEYVTSDNPRPVAKAFGEYFDKKIAPKIKEKFEKDEEMLKQKLKALN